jgi:hypothetical protein
MLSRLLNRLVHGAASETTSSLQALRDRLISVALSGNKNSLVQLCAEQAITIVREFPNWRRRPELRFDQQAARAFGAGLLGVARCMEALGHPEPMQLLCSYDGDNPIRRWESGMAESESLEEVGDLEAAYRVLLGIAKEMEGACGSAVDEYFAKVLGRMGTQRFEMGDLEGAVDFTTRALDECRRTGDAQGIGVYSENLQMLQLLTQRSVQGADLDTRATIASAQALSDEGQYDASNELLDELMRHGVAIFDSDLAPLLGKIHGLRGLNFYHLGELDQAREATAVALHACEDSGDKLGVWVYQENLRSIERAAAKGST